MKLELDFYVIGKDLRFSRTITEESNLVVPRQGEVLTYQDTYYRVVTVHHNYDYEGITIDLSEV